MLAVGGAGGIGLMSEATEAEKAGAAQGVCDAVGAGQRRWLLRRVLAFVPMEMKLVRVWLNAPLRGPSSNIDLFLL